MGRSVGSRLASGSRLVPGSRLVSVSSPSRSPPMHIDPLYASAGWVTSGAEELAAALRTPSQDNPEGGASFLIQGGRGESKKVVTEQSKIALDEPFSPPATLRSWKYTLVIAIKQCTGRTGSAVPDWVYAVEEDSASLDAFRNSGSFATLDLKLASLFLKAGWMPKPLLNPSCSLPDSCRCLLRSGRVALYAAILFLARSQCTAHPVVDRSALKWFKNLNLIVP